MGANDAAVDGRAVLEEWRRCAVGLPRPGFKRYLAEAKNNDAR